MLKVMEVHPAKDARGEYLVLQNQGTVSVDLRGWALCTMAYLQGDAAQRAHEMYVFREEANIRPYTRVVLFSGQGEDGWQETIDGRQAYCAYWKRDRGIWKAGEQVYLLHVAASRLVPGAALADTSFAGSV